MSEIPGRKISWQEAQRIAFEILENAERERDKCRETEARIHANVVDVEPEEEASGSE